MKIKKSTLIIFISLILLTSCYPMTSDYFKPSGSGGTNVDSICGSGPKDTIEFITEDNIRFFIKVTLNSKKSIDVGISIPKNNKVKINGNTFIIKDNDSLRILELKQNKIISHTDEGIEKKYSFNEILYGKSYSYNTNYWTYNYDKVYSVSINIVKYGFKNFSFQAPSFLINGKIFNLPEIKFELDTDLSFYFVNC